MSSVAVRLSQYQPNQLQYHHGQTREKRVVSDFCCSQLPAARSQFNGNQESRLPAKSGFDERDDSESLSRKAVNFNYTLGSKSYEF